MRGLIVEEKGGDKDDKQECGESYMDEVVEKKGEVGGIKEWLQHREKT